MTYVLTNELRSGIPIQFWGGGGHGFGHEEVGRFCEWVGVKIG